MENINDAKLLNKSLRIKNDSLETENIELKERIRVLKAEIKEFYWREYGDNHGCGRQCVGAHF